MSTTITRRAMLGAALALAAPTAALGPSTAAVDPIFEAVENHRAASNAFLAAAHDSADKYRAPTAASTALDDLVMTLPESRASMIALLD